MSRARRVWAAGACFLVLLLCLSASSRCQDEAASKRKSDDEEEARKGKTFQVAPVESDAKSARTTLELLTQAHKQQQQSPVSPLNQRAGNGIKWRGRLDQAQNSASNKLHQGQSRELMHYKTTYACDGNQLELDCGQEEGKLIHLVRAIYGRFSLSICNELGHSNLSVQCAAFKAFLIMENRCNTLSNCSVIVSKDLFGDPCEGTSKYLEVQYYCYHANSSHTASSAPLTPANPAQQQQQQQEQPQASISNAAPSNNNQQPRVSNKPPTSLQLDLSSPPLTNNVGGFSAPQRPSGEQSPSAPNNLAPEEGSQSVIQETQEAPQCVAQTSARNFYWPATKLGQAAHRSCPEGFSGRAQWLCDSERARFWPPSSPDFSQCRSKWLAKLEQANASARQHGELKRLLDDLVLLTTMNAVFSDDLRRIETMLGQIVAQLKSLSGSSRREQQTGAQELNEEIFNKLAQVVATLFDQAQKNAWLELAPSESRRKLEQRYLVHLREAGLWLAASTTPQAVGAQLELRAAARYPNLFAGIIPVINKQQLTLEEEVVLPVNAAPNLNRLATELQQPAQDNQQLAEVKLNGALLKELLTAGVTKFLILELRKPDYQLIKQQLELSYGALLLQNPLEVAANAGNTLDNANNLLTSAQLTESSQWSTRVLGVFALVGEGGDIFDGAAQPGARSQNGNKPSELLAQWPITIDFKLAQTPLTTGAFSASSMQPAGRQCSSLASSETSSQNRCHTHKSNSTNHVCRCDQFGFLALTNAGPAQQQSQLSVPTSTITLPDFHWPTQMLNGQQRQQEGNYDFNQQQQDPYAANPWSSNFVNVQDNNNAGSRRGQSQSSLGIWTTVFIALGLSILVVLLAAFVINLALRASNQCKLAKKQASSFFASSAANRPTTGPMPLAADHNLMGADPVMGSLSTGATQSSSIMGFSQAAAYQSSGANYKAHQQLYAAHLPPIEVCGGLASSGSRWSRAIYWLRRPTRWLSLTFGGSGYAKDGHHPGSSMIQHRIIGSTLTSPSSLSAFKGQYQNGYTTSLHHHQPSSHQHGIGHHHHHHHHTQSSANSQVPLAAPSSSTSSYVSSSAYYEEIGPGNLTKVSTSQLTGGANLTPHRNMHTIVDPFKQRNNQQASADQQQLLVNHQHHTNNNNWSQANNLSYSLQDPLSHLGGQQQQQLGGIAQQYGTAQQATLNNQPFQHNNVKQLQNDLSSPLQQHQHLHSSTSSASNSQLSPSLTASNGAPGNGTPRHYLFASPSAVNAYKSTIGQSPGQQQQPTLNQQNFNQHRFMQS